MGIVVTLFMLLGLFVLSPLPILSIANHNQQHSRIIHYIAYGLLFMGLWNILWFGLRHLMLFWGIAALISGVFMVLASIIILVESHEHHLGSKDGVKLIYSKIKSVKLFIVVGLLANCLLYGVTLIQLNLGYPIIS